MITTQNLLDRLNAQICNPHMTDEDKREAIKTAYDLGVMEGRMAGVQEMGERMVKTLDTINTVMEKPA